MTCLPENVPVPVSEAPAASEASRTAAGKRFHPSASQRGGGGVKQISVPAETYQQKKTPCLRKGSGTCERKRRSMIYLQPQVGSAQQFASAQQLDSQQLLHELRWNQRQRFRPPQH
jgi:hypothetical protein